MTAILATFYLTYALTQTSGPYNLFDKGRSTFSKDSSWLGGILHCYWCASPYFAFPTALYSQWGQWGEAAILTFALAGSASILIWILLFTENLCKSTFQFLAALVQKMN